MTSLPFAALSHNVIVSAIMAMYNVTTSINDFVDNQIVQLKQSASATVRATGNVLDGAKVGFGIGYVTPLIIISVGQLVLGNPLSAVGTVASGVLLSNPLAMTCGAIGAIFYGWKALSDDERNAIVDRLTTAFEIGVELVKSIVNFVLTSLSRLLTTENLEEFKRMVASTAHQFGRTLSDITHSVRDRISDAASAVVNAFGNTADAAIDGAVSASQSVTKGVIEVAGSVRQTADSAARLLQRGEANPTDKDEKK